MNPSTAKARIVQIDSAPLTAKRPRHVGPNAFSGAQGDTITESVVRLHTDAGVVGWARSTATPAMARLLAGRRLGEVFSVTSGTVPGYDYFDTPFWDLAGRMEECPVHKLLAGKGAGPSAVYHSAIYFEDLDPDSGADRGLEEFEGALRMGLAAGYTAFKLKIGRGNRWMERKAGFRRDVEVIHLARSVIGPGRKLLIDSNNTFTPEEARDLVREVRECDIYWFEEPFKEEIETSLPFKEFLHDSEPGILLADGEGTRPAQREIRAVIRAGAIDVVQFDFRPVPITDWLPIAGLLEEVGILAAPHNWASFFLNYYIPHFGRALPNYCTAEIDPCTMTEVDTGAYRLVDGELVVPDLPGFGLELDHEAFERRVNSEGWRVSA